jgi:hypothetical protein
MASKGYTSQDKVEAYTGESVGVSSARFDEWMESVEQFIDHMTGRNFIADSEASIRKYNGSGEAEQVIDDCIEITKVEVGTDLVTEILSTEYYSIPANTEHKNRIRRKYNVFPSGIQDVAVTAKWGYSTEVPADISFAATVIVAGILNHSLGAKGKIQSETVGRYSVSYKDDDGWNQYKGALQTIQARKKYIS